MKIGDVGNFKNLLCTFKEIHDDTCYLVTPHRTLIEVGMNMLAREWKALTPEEEERFHELVQNASHTFST